MIVLVSTHMLWPINKKEEIDVEKVFNVYMVGKRIVPSVMLDVKIMTNSLNSSSSIHTEMKTGRQRKDTGNAEVQKVDTHASSFVPTL
jgi:hypothetical protein